MLWRVMVLRIVVDLRVKIREQEKKQFFLRELLTVCQNTYNVCKFFFVFFNYEEIYIYIMKLQIITGKHIMYIRTQGERQENV